MAEADAEVEVCGGERSNDDLHVESVGSHSNRSPASSEGNEEHIDAEKEADKNPPAQLIHVVDVDGNRAPKIRRRGNGGVGVSFLERDSGGDEQPVLLADALEDGHHNSSSSTDKGHNNSSMAFNEGHTSRKSFFGSSFTSMAESAMSSRSNVSQSVSLDGDYTFAACSFVTQAFGCREDAVLDALNTGLQRAAVVRALHDVVEVELQEGDTLVGPCRTVKVLRPTGLLNTECARDVLDRRVVTGVLGVFAFLGLLAAGATLYWPDDSVLLSVCIVCCVVALATGANYRRARGRMLLRQFDWWYQVGVVAAFGGTMALVYVSTGSHWAPASLSMVVVALMVCFLFLSTDASVFKPRTRARLLSACCLFFAAVGAMVNEVVVSHAFPDRVSDAMLQVRDVVLFEASYSAMLTVLCGSLAFFSLRFVVMSMVYDRPFAIIKTQCVPTEAASLAETSEDVDESGGENPLVPFVKIDLSHQGSPSPFVVVVSDTDTVFEGVAPPSELSSTLRNQDETSQASAMEDEAACDPNVFLSVSFSVACCAPFDHVELYLTEVVETTLSGQFVRMALAEGDVNAGDELLGACAAPVPVSGVPLVPSEAWQRFAGHPIMVVLSLLLSVCGAVLLWAAMHVGSDGGATAVVVVGCVMLLAGLGVQLTRHRRGFLLDVRYSFDFYYLAGSSAAFAAVYGAALVAGGVHVGAVAPLFVLLYVVQLGMLVGSDASPFGVRGRALVLSVYIVYFGLSALLTLDFAAEKTWGADSATWLRRPVLLWLVEVTPQSVLAACGANSSLFTLRMLLMVVLSRAGTLLWYDAPYLDITSQRFDSPSGVEDAQQLSQALGLNSGRSMRFNPRKSIFRSSSKKSLMSQSSIESRQSVSGEDPLRQSHGGAARSVTIVDDAPDAADGPRRSVFNVHGAAPRRSVFTPGTAAPRRSVFAPRKSIVYRHRKSKSERREHSTGEE